MALNFSTSPASTLKVSSSNNGLSLPGLSFNNQVSNPSVGVKAPTPVTNVVKPLPKLAQPAQKDLSGTYANVNGTLYNKTTGQKFSNSADFFKDSGQNNFNAKFDTSYNPTGNETIYGQALQAPTSPLASSTAPITPTQPTPTPQTDPNALYTPPNQGTTGVSQGGIVGNLLNIARNESPEVAKARQTLQDLQNNYGQATADINSRPEGLTQQTGQQGILANLFAAKQNAAQTALSSALTSQGQQIGATSSAGGLNAPQFVSPGQVQVSPTQPVAGSTTSGAANLNSLVGTRLGADGKTTEYFNKSTGQGFSNPQQLADFVNSQTPGANANASNVFSILQQQGQGGNNILGLPNSTMQTYAQMLVSGQGNAIPASITGNVALMAQLYQMAQGLSGGNFDINVANGQGQANQQNTLAGNTALTSANLPIYQQSAQQTAALSQALNNVDNAGDFTLKNSEGNDINPFSSKFLNETIGAVRDQFGSAGYAQFMSNVSNLKALVIALNAQNGGTPTSSVDYANNLINENTPLSTLKVLVDNAKQEGHYKLQNAAQTGQSAYNNVQSSNPAASNGGTTVSAGGSTFVQDANGKWVAK